MQPGIEKLAFFRKVYSLENSYVHAYVKYVTSSQQLARSLLMSCIKEFNEVWLIASHTPGWFCALDATGIAPPNVSSYKHSAITIRREKQGNKVSNEAEGNVIATRLHFDTGGKMPRAL